MTDNILKRLRHIITESENNTLKVFEAFAGIGSQHQALKNLGINFTVVGISEINDKASRAYNVIHGDDIKNYGDITKIEQFPDMDLLTYSFPCQDLSTAGKGKGMEQGSGTRSSLLWEIGRVVEQKKPHYLLLENVANILSSKYVESFNKWKSFLEEHGYKNYVLKLNAVDFGVPQTRNRVFMVSTIGNENFNFNFEPIKKGFKEIMEIVKDRKYYDPTNAPFMKKGIDSGKIKVVDPEAPIGSTKNNTWALTTKQNRNSTSIIKTDDGNRLITPREALRLMAFPDEVYDKLVKANFTDADIYKFAGNSIVVSVLMAIFKEMFVNNK